MKKADLSGVVARMGVAILAILVGVGVFRAFSRGANDFSVFFEAWRLVLSGHGSEIYRVSPDRFLYSPGFAWLLAPLAFFPKSISLALWCFFKGAVLIFLLMRLSRSWGERRRGDVFSFGVTAWGIVLIARPLLIDMEYGQVNLFILAACLWGLTSHFRPSKGPVGDFCPWFFLTFAAVAKLFPLPLLLVPWGVTSGISIRKLKVERWAIVLAVAIAVLIPVFSQGWSGTGLSFWIGEMRCWREVCPWSPTIKVLLHCFIIT